MKSDTTTRIFLVLAAVSLAGALVTEARAENLPREHEGGVFLRLSGGVGSARSSADDYPVLGDFELSGLSGDYNFAIGGIVARDLAVHGTLWGWSVSDPDAESSTLGSGEVDASVSMNGIGGGVTKYLGPSNFYLSGSVGLGVLSIETPDGDANTDPGFAMDATIGKEWWVGGKWGLGVAGAMSYHSVPDGDFDVTWSGLGFGVRFSATLN